MKIANFRDYVKVLREVYSRENMDELGNYYRALMASGSALKKAESPFAERGLSFECGD